MSSRTTLYRNMRREANEIANEVQDEPVAKIRKSEDQSNPQHIESFLYDSVSVRSSDSENLDCDREFISSCQ